MMVGCQTLREGRFDGQIPDIPEVEIWRMVFFGIFLHSLFSYSLYFLTSLDLGPVQMASAPVFTTSGDMSSVGGVSPCARSAERLPYSTNRVWDLWVRTFAYVERLFDRFHSFPTLVHVYAAQGVCTMRGGQCYGTAARDVFRAGYHPLRILRSPRSLDL